MLWGNARTAVLEFDHGSWRAPVLGSNEQIFGANEQVPKGGCGRCPKNAPGPGNSVRDILIFAGGGLSAGGDGGRRSAEPSGGDAEHLF
jgi:hypothetical protein